MSKVVFKKDQYKSNRPGRSRLLDITCERCKNHLCYYQKDGPGNLRRMYIDRIIAPTVSIKNKELLCNEGHNLGIKVIYEKENRPAFRLFVDAVEKKIVSRKEIDVENII